MNAHGAVLQAYYDKLNGNVSGFNVYKVDVPETEEGNYIVVRPESGTGQNNKRSINDNLIIITDIVTVFENNINSDVVDDADAIVYDLIVPTASSNGLAAQAGIDIWAERESFDYLPDADGTKNYFRKISRYKNRVHNT